ncbi:hypothetical protein [Sphingomonas sp. CFBP 8760]|uniref:hypothetical protein n=1 Tax=Sphingomonas sp. CFBP 8760 TaxID=2775282 RepID=UPI001A90E3A7|nr:hypothetical protein [Sphingomonas sp. CFBP 8760]
MAQGPAPQPLIESLRSCRAIAQDDRRIACYDRAADALLRAERDRDIVVMDRAQVQQAKRSLFGFSLPSIRLFGDGDGDGRDGKGSGDGQLKQLAGTLRSPTLLPGGLLRFALDDGGVWETTEQVMSPPRDKDIVTIKAGALGSYIATAPGRRSVKVRRIR